jgi:cation/acetate symporter
MNKQGAISGMLAGILFTATYIIYFTYLNPELNNPDHWWFGISPEGIGALGMVINLVIAVIVSRFTVNPPEHIQDLIEHIRIPRDFS